MVKIIDATDLILGRLSAYVAKLSLMGERVIVVNSEKAVVSGSKKNIKKEYKEKRERGEALKGPFYPKQADRIVKRAIRGMLPYKQEKGRRALKRVTCHIGVPKQYAEQKIETLESASVNRLSAGKYLSLKELSQSLGAKNG